MVNINPKQYSVIMGFLSSGAQKTFTMGAKGDHVRF